MNNDKLIEFLMDPEVVCEKKISALEELKINDPKRIIKMIQRFNIFGLSSKTVESVLDGSIFQ